MLNIKIEGGDEGPTDTHLERAKKNPDIAKDIAEIALSSAIWRGGGLAQFIAEWKEIMSLQELQDLIEESWESDLEDVSDIGGRPGENNLTMAVRLYHDGGDKDS